MILANGLIRTLDPQVPTQRALAIAGDRIAGGVGVHETALASPETLDLGGRVVVPGLHRLARPFPDLGARAARGEARRLRVARRGARPDPLGVAPEPGRLAPRLRLAERRLAARSASRHAHDLDAITGDTPAALIAKDYHSLWLNSAALALAGGDLDVAGGVVERDADGEPTGVLREEAAWRFKERHMRVSDDAYLDGDARRHPACELARRHVGPRQGRLARRASALAASSRSAGRSRCASGSRSRTTVVDARSGRRPPLGPRQPDAARRLPEGVHGRHARLADGVDARRSAASRSRAARSSPRSSAAARRPASPSACTRSATARTARRSTRSRRPRTSGNRSGSATASSTASCSRPRTSPASPSSASRARCSSRTRRPTATSPTASGRARPTAPTRSSRCSTRAPWSRTAPTRRSRSSIRSPASAPACAARSTTATPGTREQCLTVDEAFRATCVAPAWLAGDERRRGTLIPGHDADLVVLDRDPWDDLDAQVVATMVGGPLGAQSAAVGLTGAPHRPRRRDLGVRA